MKNKLLRYTDNFNTSRPVFKLTVSKDEAWFRNDDTCFKFTPTPIDGDSLSEIVCKAYYESFDHHENMFVLDKHSIVNNAIQMIKDDILHFVGRNVKLKNPFQGGLYKWVRRPPRDNEELENGFILLYKYIKETVEKESLNKQAHIDNVIALLEGMREKYGERS